MKYLVCSEQKKMLNQSALTSLTAISIALSALYATPAHAVKFGGGEWSGSWDTTVSYGAGVRIEDQDKDLISLASGGTRDSGNSDDGNLNFKNGDVFTNVLKLSTELEVSRKNLGAFFRVNALYDDVIANDKTAERAKNNHAGSDPKEFHKVKFTDEAKDLAGSRIELFDAYFFGEHELGSMPVGWKLGNQVISWGESTFIQNSINSINPIDVTKLRVPGSELKEAFIPVPIASANIGLTDNLSMGMFYQIAWEPFRIDPTGAYFSKNDFAGAGGDSHGVMLTSGGTIEYEDKLGGATPLAGLGPDGLPDLSVRQGKTREARDDGQFGLAFRLFAPSLNDTEFGFYAMNYHSRLPITSAQTASQAKVTEALTRASAAGLPSNDVRRAVLNNTLTVGEGSAKYVIEYPEDIQLFGLSFNTLVGGTALQGEISHRIGVPLQIDDAELLQSAIAASGNSAACANPALAAFCNPLRYAAANNYLGSFKPGDYIEGYRRKDVSQFQITATQAFSNVLGAQQAFLVGELGVNHVHDMESKDKFKYEVPGGDASGNPALTTAAGKFKEPEEHFADPTSWGYVVAGKLKYLNAIGSVSLMPKFSFSHDVEGNSPGPGGSFMEGRQSASLGLGFAYGEGLNGGIQVTSYLDDLIINELHDRDFASFNVSYAF